VSIGIGSSFTLPFDFQLGVAVLHDVLSYCKKASDYLQTEDLDIGTATLAISDLKLQIQQLRTDDKFKTYCEITEAARQRIPLLQGKCETSGCRKTKRKIPKKILDGYTDRFLTGANVEGLHDSLRVDFYFAVIDSVLVNLHARFGERSVLINNGVAALQFGSCGQNVATKLNSIRELAKHYDCNVAESARQYELASGNALLSSGNLTLKAVWKIFNDNDYSRLYNDLAKLLQIAVTLPVTSASAERVHSKLKLVKSVLRSTSGNTRTSELVHLYVEKSKTTALNLAGLVDIFALKPRKLRL
jgi:hypothetical protein